MKGSCSPASPGTIFAWIISARRRRKRRRKASRRTGKRLRPNGKRPSCANLRRRSASPSRCACRWRACASAAKSVCGAASPWPILPRPWSNEKKADHFFHWTQHVTLSPPFLGHDTSRIAISATRGRTSAAVTEAMSCSPPGATFIGPLPRREAAEASILRAPSRARGWDSSCQFC